MKRELKLNLIIVPLLFLFLFGTLEAQAKAFKRALIISGGGVSPGVALGIIQGLKDKGWNPDVIITTCGSSIASALLNVYPTNDAALEYAQSQEFQGTLRDIKVHTVNALRMKKEFDRLEYAPDEFPDLFGGDLLNFPETGKDFLPDVKFQATEGAPRFIMVAGKANFNPDSDIGDKRTELYTETYFTDSETAKLLQGFKSPIKEAFPGSFLKSSTAVVTDRTVGEAARASISDPFLINPALLGSDYYFTGAIDLVPLKLAHELADEVISTTPNGFEDYEENAVTAAFGFSQREATDLALRDQTVTFIDPYNVKKVSMDPKNFLIWFHTGVPKIYSHFRNKIQKQYDFGYEQVEDLTLPHD
jgi:predicted acylesterase/phospholipase RssA